MKPLAKPASLTDRVYEHVKAMIQAGQFSTVQPVYETQLAASLGVSRTPVREAFRMLEREGYVETQVGGGVTAYPIKPQDLADLLEARIALEQVTARLAAERANPISLAQLDNVLALSQKALDEGHLADILYYNESFHRVLASATGAHFLEHMVDRIYDFVTTHRLNRNFGASQWHMKTLQDVFNEHSLIVEAVRAGDAELAARRMQYHLKEVGERYARNLGEQQPETAESSA